MPSMLSPNRHGRAEMREQSKSSQYSDSLRKVRLEALTVVAGQILLRHRGLRRMAYGL